MLRDVSLFIVDESSMVPIHAFDAIDRLLRDITGNDRAFGGKVFLWGGDFRQVLGNDRAFGGKVFLWGGDFRQVLPIVRHGNPSEQCIKSSKHWPYVIKYQLIQNMRMHQDEIEFGEWLLSLGDGRLPARDKPPFEGCIRIPDGCVTQSIVSSIFGEELVHHAVGNRVILCPTNEETLWLNESILICYQVNNTHTAVQMIVCQMMMMNAHNIQSNFLTA